MGEGDIQDKLEEYLGRIPEHFNILEEQINIQLQSQYFKFSSRIKKKKLDAEKILLSKSLLFKKTTPAAKKKELLVKLASIDDVQAFRTIEKYVKKPDPDLKDWAILSLQESRMLIESSLLDESQVFISTGLGGKANKLRYFIVLFSSSEKPLSSVQKKLVRSEFEFILKRKKGEIEEVHFSGLIVTLLILLPLEISIRDVFKEAIQECNQYGNFLMTNFIITNVKKLTIREINQILKDNSEEEN